MCSYRQIIALFSCLLFAGLSVMSAPGLSSAQQTKFPPSQEQWQQLQAASQISDPRSRVAALDQFLQEHPDTPYLANVYRLQFLSYREFSRDHDHLWNLGQRYLTEFTGLIDATSDPYEKNPLLAHMYNEVAYEFAGRNAHLDGALEYAQQSLSLIEQAAKMRSPKVPETQWAAGVSTFRGQILDTVGWIQYQRDALADAEKAIMDALELIPENGAVHFHHGQIARAQGRTEEAINAFLMAATVERPDPAAREELDRLYREKYGNAAAAGLQLETALKAAGTRAQARKIRRLVANRLNVPAPNFTITALNGDTVSLPNLKGKVVVVNFWATWCMPCRKEMPALQKVWETYREKDVAFLIASVDKEQDKVGPYIDEHRYTFPVYYGEPAAQVYSVISVPTTVVIDKHGNIQYKHIGYRPDIFDVLSWQIDALMEEE